jgi:hypothetical protein
MVARPFLKTRFRAVAGRQDEGDHWLGGVPPHRGATCPVCHIPLLLLWDINCRDPRFRRGKFGPLERLPLYFCWGCVSDLAYQVRPRGGLKVYRTEVMRHGPSFQYQPYPSHFERRPLALIPGVPDAVRIALSEWNPEKDPLGKRLTPRRAAIIAEYLGHPITVALCLFHSQFGGVPLARWWGEEVTPCPNPECRDGLPGRLWGDGRGRMRFLAGVLNDPLGGLPMVEPPHAVTPRWWNFFVSVEFQICDRCWTVHARNRSD